MPSANILIEDYQDFDDFAYFCTLGKRGVMIEVGPQAQANLRADIYVQTCEMTQCVLAFLEAYNQHSLTELQAVEAFRLGTEICYPSKTEHGKSKKTAMIHPQLFAKDFSLLKKGAPCFIDFDGNTIAWDGDDTYPHFIAESAYFYLDIAFATAELVKI